MKKLHIFPLIRSIVMILVITLQGIPAYAATTPEQKQAWQLNYVGDEDVSICDTPTASTGSTTSTDGAITYQIPATSGKAGREEAINPDGTLVSGGSGKVTFAQFASLGQNYRDYYITMRWGYVSWNWNGTSGPMVDANYHSWLSQKPRIVHVTNPRTGKSIYAAVLESGPAPWTGVDKTPNNAPKQGWTNPQTGTPATYTGRVSGFPPVAFDALGVQMGMSDGKGGSTGDTLQYEWAADQSVSPGPANDATMSTAYGACTTQGGGTKTPGKNGWDLTGEHAMVFYDQYDPKWASKPYGVGRIDVCACGPTSMAMIISTLTTSTVTPDVVAQTYAERGGQATPECGSKWAWGLVMNQYPLEMTDLGTSMDKAKDIIKNGGLVLVSWNGAPFTSAGHIFVIRGFSDDGTKVYVASSGGTTNRAQSDTAWDISIFTSGYTGPAVPNRGSNGSLQHMWGFIKK